MVIELNKKKNEACKRIKAIIMLLIYIKKEIRVYSNLRDYYTKNYIYSINNFKHYYITLVQTFL
jgi:hypothetical protein